MSNDLKRLIGIRIRAARKARNLSQAALAELVSRTEEAISNIERGLAMARLDLLHQFSEILQVPLEAFVQTTADGADVAERVRLEIEARMALQDLPVDRLRIAVRQIAALRKE